MRRFPEISVPNWRRSLPRSQRKLRPAILPINRLRKRSSRRSDQAMLQQLAQRLGIQTSYLDMGGRQQEASPETLKAILALWGIETDNSQAIQEALREQEQRHWRQPLAPVTVAWDGQPTQIEVRLPADLEPREAHCQLHLEEGRCRRLDWPAGRNRPLETAEIEGVRYVIRSLLLPALPVGYHQLEIEVRARVHRSLIIAAPTKSYSPPGAPKSWGLFLPMYAAHSAQSWGAGNLQDWQQLSDWVAQQGGNVMGTLPLLAAFLDRPICEPSPYSPASRLFWNEFFLDISRVPELAACPAAQRLVRSAPFQQQLQAFRQSPLIDYKGQMALRRQVLEPLAKSFFASNTLRRGQFDRFLRERPEAIDYAEFRATCDRSKTSWHTWQERMRHGKLQKEDYAEADKRYHLYTQWLAQEQINAFLKHCRSQGLQFYLDLPLGVHPDGYDLWRERDAFGLPASAGAPPDFFFTKGQNWGFAPLHPQHIRERGYHYVLQYLRFQMRHTGLLRIDHVMGLHRLFWIPPGLPASQGAYVSYPAEELHALLSLESHRHQTVLVGENLGTVPPEVNAAMARHGLRQMYVVQYEQRPEPKQPLRPVPAFAVASVNTHDMPTFTAHWQGQDILDRTDLGLIPKDKVAKEQAQRKRMNAMLAAYLRRQGLLKAERADAAAVLQACLAWLSASPAELVLLNLEDLWQEELPQNVPGTSTERPNWRRKARLSIEQIQQAPELRDLLKDCTLRRKDNGAKGVAGGKIRTPNSELRNKSEAGK
ncbi:MAG TPA: 4-alpha-glucanotransferase [Bacillota bacterium]|nr:4-alpha-glucanotransferase [Bacillota bacterium]